MHLDESSRDSAVQSGSLSGDQSGDNQEDEVFGFSSDSDSEGPCHADVEEDIEGESGNDDIGISRKEKKTRLSLRSYLGSGLEHQIENIVVDNEPEPDLAEAENTGEQFLVIGADVIAVDNQTATYYVIQ